MSENIREYLHTRTASNNKFTLQIGESTDVAGVVRYCFEENIQEQFMFCPLLSEGCTGNDVLKATKGYFTPEDIFWTNCVGVCADGAATLAGYKKGLRDEVLKIAPCTNFIHCIIHREALISRDL
jgi:hypothetical protein